MATRESIESDYEVAAGIIQTPGKFEGCPVYVPYFWDSYLDGMSDDDIDEDGVLISKFEVDDEDRLAFPELERTRLVELWADDQGFVQFRAYDRV